MCFHSFSSSSAARASSCALVILASGGVDEAALLDDRGSRSRCGRRARSYFSRSCARLACGPRQTWTSRVPPTSIWQPPSGVSQPFFAVRSGLADGAHALIHCRPPPPPPPPPRARRCRWGMLRRGLIRIDRKGNSHGVGFTNASAERAGSAVEKDRCGVKLLTQGFRMHVLSSTTSSSNCCPRQSVINSTTHHNLP